MHEYAYGDYLHKVWLCLRVVCFNVSVVHWKSFRRFSQLYSLPCFRHEKCEYLTPTMQLKESIAPGCWSSERIDHNSLYGLQHSPSFISLSPPHYLSCLCHLLSLSPSLSLSLSLSGGTLIVVIFYNSANAGKTGMDIDIIPKEVTITGDKPSAMSIVQCKAITCGGDDLRELRLHYKQKIDSAYKTVLVFFSLSLSLSLSLSPCFIYPWLFLPFSSFFASVSPLLSLSDRITICTTLCPFIAPSFRSPFYPSVFPAIHVHPLYLEI